MCSGRITMIGPGVGKIDICPPLPHHPAQSLSNPISSSGPAPLSAARAEPRTLASPFVLLFLLIQLILVFPFMQIVRLPPSLLLIVSHLPGGHLPPPNSDISHPPKKTFARRTTATPNFFSSFFGAFFLAWLSKGYDLEMWKMQNI